MTLRAALLSVLACSVAGCGTSVPAPTALPRAQPLTIDSVFPPSGRPGNPIRIYGTGLSGDTTVLIGNALAHKIEVLSSESITVESPVLEVGTVDVVITNPRGERAVLSAAYTTVAVRLTALTTDVRAGDPVSVTWSAPRAQPGDFVAFVAVGSSATPYDEASIRAGPRRAFP